MDSTSEKILNLNDNSSISLVKKSQVFYEINNNEISFSNNKSEFSKNHKFKLRGLKILGDLNGSTYDKLPPNLQNKILDFQLYMVEIDQTQNPNFDPN